MFVVLPVDISVKFLNLDSALIDDLKRKNSHSVDPKFMQQAGESASFQISKRKE